MDRGERRYHALRVRTRRLHLLRVNFGPWGRESVRERPWQALNEMGRWLMRDPGRWEREMMIRPARSEQNQMLRRGEYEGVFPNYRKPVIYYW